MKASTARSIGVSQRTRQSMVLMAPFFLFFLVFTVLPVVLSIVFSFTSYDMLNAPKFAGLDNYIRMILDDDVMLTAIKNTLIFAMITGPIGYIASFLVAWLINDLPPMGRTLTTIVFYAPALSGQAYTMWSYVFSSDSYGIINAFLINLGFIKEPIAWLTDPVYVMPTLIIVQLWLSLGTSFLAFIAGLQNVDPSLYEAAAIDGVQNRFQELWYVTLPSMVPQLVFGAVMTIVSSFSVSDVSINLAGFPSTEYCAEMIVTHIMDYGTIRFEMGYACAMATVLFAAMYITKRVVTGFLGRIGR